MQLFVNNLTNVDFSYLDPERGLVGETWLASILLDGELDQQSMIWDFGVVKKTLRDWLDNDIDHRLAVPCLAENLRYSIDEKSQQIELTWKFNDTFLTMSAPRQAVALIDCKIITAESVALWCKQQLQPYFPENLEQLQLTFTPENIDGDFYHYSHGLKKHDGNCQRIAHGHRSRLNIFLEGQRQNEIEKDWCEKWRDIYIASQSDIKSEDDSHLHCAYDAPQGHFELSIPKSVSDIMPTDSTVELIAVHIAQALNQQHNKSYTVQAFEGIDKGAFAKG